jgi:hypothetical protein
MQLLIGLFGGCSLTLHIGELPPFQVPLPFTVWRSAFGVHIVLVLVLVLDLVPIPFHAISRLQRLEGSRFAPWQVLIVRLEGTNPELPDDVASERQPGTAPAFGFNPSAGTTRHSRGRRRGRVLKRPGGILLHLICPTPLSSFVVSTNPRHSNRYPTNRRS